MFHASEVMQLEEGETIQSINRRHVGTMMPGLLLAAVLILLPSFFLFRLLQIGTLGVILAVMSFGYGLFRAAKTFLLWDSQILLLTDRRIVHVNQSGLWRRAVNEVPLRLVQAVEHESHGLGDLLLRTAKVQIRASGAAPLVSFSGLTRVNHFSAQVIKARDLLSAPGFETVSISKIEPV